MRKEELVKKFCKYYFAFQQVAINPKIRKNVKDFFMQKLDEIKLEIEKIGGYIEIPKENSLLSPSKPLIVFKDLIYTLRYENCIIEREKLLKEVLI
jgi:hypothetical protein